jgi:hypothetical protein
MRAARVIHIFAAAASRQMPADAICYHYYAAAAAAAAARWPLLIAGCR